MPDTTEQEFEQIVVPLLAPQIARILAYCVTALGTVGVTIIPSQDSAYKIASGAVAALWLIGTEIYVKAHAKSNAQAAFTQGAASAGATLLPQEVPPVVSGAVPIQSIPVRKSPSAGMTPFTGLPTSQPVVPVADSAGNLTFKPTVKPVDPIDS